MKKKIILPLLLLCLCGATAACSQKNVPSKNPSDPSAVTLALSKETLVLDTYQTLWLIADYDGTENVVWTTSDESVVSVEKGKLTGLKAGTATVTVTAGVLSDSCTVTVNGYKAEKLSLSVAENNISLHVGDEYQISPIVNYDGAGTALTATYEYISSNTAIAEISKSGEVTAKAAGCASITVLGRVGEETLGTTVNIEVISSGRVEIEQREAQIYALSEFANTTFKNTVTLTAKAYEKDEVQSSPTITWSAERDQDVLTVNNGVVIARNAGSATVTATYTDKSGEVKTDTVVVEVLPVQVKNSAKLELGKNKVANGYVVNVEEVFGDANAEITGAWVQDGDLKATLVTENNRLYFDNVSTGEKTLYVQTRNIACEMPLQFWTGIIETAEDMQVLYTATNGKYRLSADIDMSGSMWEYQTENVFSGTFDGKGYAIQNFTVSGNAGLFAVLGEKAVVCNVKFENAKIGKGVSGGVLARTVKSATNTNVTVENVYAHVDISGSLSGGLFGSVAGKLTLKNISGMVTRAVNDETNGALFATASSNVTAENVKVYSGLTACGKSAVNNSSAESLNKKSLTVAPTAYNSTIDICDIEEAGKFSLNLGSDAYKNYTVYGNTARQGEQGGVVLVTADVESRFGGFVDVLLEKTDGSKEYYSISLDSTIYLTQDNFEKYAKTQTGKLILTEDIVLSGTWTTSLEFTGTFDGQGHSISGLEPVYGNGLFKKLTDATVKNLVIYDAILGDQISAIAYNASGTVLIENVYVSVATQRFGESTDNGKTIDSNYVHPSQRYKGGMFSRLTGNGVNVTVSDCVVYMPEFLAREHGFVAGFSSIAITVENSTFIGGNGRVFGLRDKYNGIPEMDEESVITDAVTAHRTYKAKWTELMKTAYNADHPYIELTAANFEEKMPTLTREVVYLTENITATSAWNTMTGKKATFTGVFDGGEHKITGLDVTSGGGLFLHLAGSVKNVAVIGKLTGNTGLITDTIGYNGRNDLHGMAYIENVYVEVISSTYSQGAPIARYLHSGDVSLKNVVTNVTAGAGSTPGFIGYKDTSKGKLSTCLAENCYAIMQPTTTKGSLMWLDGSGTSSADAYYFVDATVYTSKTAFDTAYQENSVTITEFIADILYPNS